MISFEEALALTLAHAGDRKAVEAVALSHCLGRRLAREIRADMPWPQTDRSAMDGFAVRAGANGLVAETSLQVVGECLAGHPFAGDVADGQAIRIMTGAVVPACVDCVVPVENTSGYQGETVTLHKNVAAGDNIRRLGSEVAEGDVLMAVGTRIGAAEVGALAVLGIDPAPVFARPTVAILATGDEVVEIDQQPQPYQVRNSNAWALAAQVAELGGTPMQLGIARDEEQDLRARIERGLQNADVLLSIGGVSKGTHDLVHRIYADMGIETIYHGVAIKPGKPTFFGVKGDPDDRRYVFGLPGNPASCYTIFDLFTAPLLTKLCGGELSEPLLARRGGQPFRKNWRLQAVPTSLRVDVDGSLFAELHSSKPSGDPFGLLGARSYAIVPADQEPDASATVPITGLDLR